MPKQPDLIAGEMQGDATVPAAVEEAAAAAYERRKTDRSVIASIDAIVESGKREFAGVAQESASATAAPRSGKPPSNGSRRGRRSFLKRD
jgi:hypothetical protein